MLQCHLSQCIRVTQPSGVKHGNRSRISTQHPLKSTSTLQETQEKSIKATSACNGKAIYFFDQPGRICEKFCQKNSLYKNSSRFIQRLMVIVRVGVNVYCLSFMAKLSFFLFAINFPQRLRTAFKIAIYGSFQRLSPASLSEGTVRRKGEHMCGIKKAFYTSPHEILRAGQPSKETDKRRGRFTLHVKSVPNISESNPPACRDCIKEI